MRGLHLTADGAASLAAFLDEWKHGWAGLTDVVSETNRLAMQKQLVMLIASNGTTTGKQAPKKEG